MSRIKNWLAAYDEVQQDWDDSMQDPQDAAQYDDGLASLAHEARTLLADIEDSWPGEILP